MYAPLRERPPLREQRQVPPLHRRPPYHPGTTPHDTARRRIYRQHDRTCEGEGARKRQVSRKTRTVPRLDTSTPRHTTRTSTREPTRGHTRAQATKSHQEALAPQVLPHTTHHQARTHASTREDLPVNLYPLYPPLLLLPLTSSSTRLNPLINFKFS